MRRSRPRGADTPEGECRPLATHAAHGTEPHAECTGGSLGGRVANMWVSKKCPILPFRARPLPVLRLRSRMVENDRVEEKAIFGPCCVFPFWTPKSPFLHTSTPSPPKFSLAPNGASPLKTFTCCPTLTPSDPPWRGECNQDSVTVAA